MGIVSAVCVSVGIAPVVMVASVREVLGLVGIVLVVMGALVREALMCVLAVDCSARFACIPMV